MTMSQRILQALLVLLIMEGRLAAAADWFVETTGNDGNDCTAPGPSSACLTIQAAIDKASPGDTIHVAAGTYAEPAPGPLAITKTLTLLGEQSGVDARVRIGPESVVTDPEGTAVMADEVVVDGFTIQESTAGSTGFGIWMGAATAGTQILNDVIQDNVIGIGLSNSGALRALIRHNLIQNNNQPGSASGTGIYTDQFVSAGALKNVLIEENAFIGNDDAGIDVSNTDPDNGVSGLEVSTNSFDANGRAVVLFNTFRSSIHGNQITNSTYALSAAIRVLDNNRNLSIVGNDLMTGVFHAIRLSDLDLVDPGNPSPSANVVIHENNIAFFAGEGLLVDPGSHVGTVNAECNWWNSPTGPMNDGNPTGTGEGVAGDADFTPWLVAPAPGGGCVGGVPSTPGRVTGGGQVASDSSNARAQATFGFEARCCAPTGNLEYNDHQAGVRIKSESVGGLSCPTIPGSRHASFNGVTVVIRSTGTTTELVTVDVDDCGEPGKSDTFGISTTSYSNGPSTLAGGNIQIHQ
ncbi:MAG: hypothetical protein DMF79_10515 [Acidobacteria bacterium]|nr:MAG: hypothetical protein DMF79_10515 [Acidobacteriota bacterium]